MADETAASVADFTPDRVLLLPLYPQFSTTTTASSWRDWTRAARLADLKAPTSIVCCYPAEAGFIAAMAAMIGPALDAARVHGCPRLLLSAHGLPRRVVAAGDPYQWQCEETARALVAALGHDGLDWVGCYQSRVGPLEWIDPATDAEIDRAGRDRVPVVLAPIAFVSEHSETLVELDIEYRRRAERAGVPYYARVPTVSTAPAFIAGLADTVRAALASDPKEPATPEGKRLCPARFGGCPCGAAPG